MSFSSYFQFNKQEALTILKSELEKYEKHGYGVLKEKFVDENKSDFFEITGRSRDKYRIIVSGSVHNKETDNLKITGRIDNGKFSSFFPLKLSFIINQNGSFIG